MTKSTVQLEQEKVALQSRSVTTRTVPAGTVKFSGSVPSECDLVHANSIDMGEPWQRSVTSDVGSCPTWVLGKFVTNTLSICDAEADANIPVMKVASTTMVTMNPSFLFNQSPPSETRPKVALKKAKSAFSFLLTHLGPTRSHLPAAKDIPQVGRLLRISSHSTWTRSTRCLETLLLRISSMRRNWWKVLLRRV